MFSHGIYTPNVGGSVPSRREVFPIWELLIFILITPAIYWIITTDYKTRKRGIYMFIMMFILGCIWYLAYWLSGQRWVEIGTNSLMLSRSIIATVPGGFLSVQVSNKIK